VADNVIAGEVLTRTDTFGKATIGDKLCDAVQVQLFFLALPNAQQELTGEDITSTSDGEVHSRCQRALNPGFIFSPVSSHLIFLCTIVCVAMSAEGTRGMFSRVVEAAQSTIEQLKPGEEYDIR